MKQAGITALLVIVPLFAIAQFGAYDHVKISAKHSEKLSKITSPARKLKKYHKFYSKDSIKLVRNLDRYWKQKSDSVTKSITGIQQQIGSKKVDAASDKLKNSVQRIQSPVDATSAKKKFPGKFSPFRKLSMFKRPNPADNPAVKYALAMKAKTMEYQDQVRKYQGYSDMSADSLRDLGSAKLEKETFQRLQSLTGLKDYQKDMAQLNQMQAMRDQWKQQMGDLTDSTKRIELAKQKASQAAMSYIQNNPVALKATQRKMSLLMKKYSFVGNSADLSTAIKKTSLHGKSFREHLVIAANFQVLSLQPISIDFSPMIGYKFNTKLAIGVGGTYRKTFSDSIPAMSPTVLGYKGFISYNAFKSFFVYGEYDQNSPGTIRLENVSKRIWKPAALIGVGRTFSVHKKIDMTVTALYNFLYEHGDPIYPRPFVVRFGFQLSELALLKHKPPLKP